jgi:hypothetical protein
VVDPDWTPEEENAWRELERRCPTAAQTLAAAKRTNVGYVYLCQFCGEHHITELASEARNVLRP